MKKLFTFLLLLAGISASAQPQFLSPGAEWWYAFKGGFLISEGWHHIYIEKDTVVANYNCKKLIDDTYIRYGSNDTLPFSLNSRSMFIRQQGDSVFIYYAPVWMLRWRTDPQVGDTYTMQVYTWSTTELCDIKVDSIRELDINGQLVKKIYQHGALSAGPNIIFGGGQVAIYSHIGPEYGTFDYIRCWGSLDCNDSYICRFKNDSIPLYQFNNYNCDLISATHDFDWSRNLKVSPNPCGDYLTFDFGPSANLSGATIALIDQSGRQIQNTTIESDYPVRIETAKLVPGIYFYFISHKNGRQVGKFCKIN